MKNVIAAGLAGWMVCGLADGLLAHHSLANYDTTRAVRVKGTVVLVHQINPHSFIYLDETSADGSRRRWAVEGPPVLNIVRRGLAKDFLKAGDVIEVCGYLPKETTYWQIASPDAAANSVSMSGRLINAELLVMPDGREQSWGDYGFHKCFAPGYTDQHQNPQ